MKAPLARYRTSRAIRTFPQWASQYSVSARRGVRLQTQIISPSLCRDVLERLEPALRSYHECDLIDYKPGESLWSPQLCDALKPRRYVLVDENKRSLGRPGEENQQQAQASTLKECLDPAKDLLSPYILASLNEGYTKLNKSLLVSANLSGPDLSTSKYTGSAAQYFFHDLYASMFGMRENLFRYGLARLLAWVPNDVAHVLLPRGVDARNRLSLRLEAAFSITQIAASSHTSIPSQDRRWADLELENWHALKLTRSTTPQDRIDGPPLPMLASLEPDPVTLRSSQFTTGADYIEEWLALDAQLRESNPNWFKSRIYDKKLVKGSKGSELMEMTQWRQFYTRAKTIHRRHWKIASAIRLQRELDTRYREYLTSGKPEDGEMMQSIRTHATKLKDLIDSLSRDAQIQVRKGIDDYRAYDASHRALEWNKRAVDPLVVQPDEFTSRKPLALLVLMPRSSFRQRLDTDSKATCFEYVVNRLTTSRWSSSIYDALKGLLQGGVDEFVEMVPSLKDPVRGGWLDPKDLRVRSLPASTFVDIAVAYEQWPFRPDTTKMMFEMAKDSPFMPDD